MDSSASMTACKIIIIIVTILSKQSFSLYTSFKRNVMCKDTSIAILSLTYKYPIYKFKKFNRDIAGKYIAGDTFWTYCGSLFQEAMELGKLLSLKSKLMMRCKQWAWKITVENIWGFLIEVLWTVASGIISQYLIVLPLLKWQLDIKVIIVSLSFHSSSLTKKPSDLQRLSFQPWCSNQAHFSSSSQPSMHMWVAQ